MSDRPLLEGPKRPAWKIRAWVGPALILGAVGLGVWWCSQQPRQRSNETHNLTSQEDLQRRRQREAEAAQREAQGSILLHSNRISETEEISIVELPPSARAGIITPGYYSQCIIYKNAEYRVVHFVCGSASGTTSE